jgi:glycosyltransferase involved in cell wall biosynthesis
VLQIIKKAVRHEGGIQALASKTWLIAKREGIDGIMYRLQFLRNKPQVTSPNSEIYLYRPDEFNDQIRAELEAFEYKPLISIVMPVYNVQSILDQWYPNWELCICNDKSTDKSTLEALARLQSDKRVKVVNASKNGGISRASNMALELASGEYSALMDHDDELTSNALFEVIKALQAIRHDFIYSDEDKIEESGHFSEPHFKPDFCEDYFLSTNYLSHLGVLKTDMIRQVGGWSEGVEGAQDYDLYLKVAEVASSVHHIPKVLYHWRKVAGSTAVSFDMKSSARESGRISVEQAIARRSINASVIHGLQPGTYRVKYDIEGEPLVSIVIPFRDKFNLLSVCLNSLLANDDYENFEVICVDNNSEQEEITPLRRYFAARDSRIRFVDYKEEFNYSRINNWAVKEHCRGEYIVFMNNDIEILIMDWLSSLLEHAQREKVGAVGAKLLYPNGTIQHAGIVLAPDASNATISAFQNLGSAEVGYFSRPQCLSNYSAVTAALMMVKLTDFEAIGGFDEEKLKIAYNDVDLCLRLADFGKSNIYTPFVVAHHYESASRGHADSPDKLDAHGRELQSMKAKHIRRFNAQDRHYNPNLAQNRSDFCIHPKLSRDYKNYVERIFDTEIKSKKMIKPISSDSICVFAHYDSSGDVAPYVLYLLKAISAHFEIVFVSTAPKLSGNSLKELSSVCSTVILRENVGYDFGSWKAGLEHLDYKTEACSRLLLANDSSFGPIFDLEVVLDKWNKSGADVFGITDSYEIRYHLQSYFMLFGTAVTKSPEFKEFWRNIRRIEDKSSLIQEYEIGLSQKLLSLGMCLDCLAPAANIGYLNNTHLRWKELILEYQSPFVKIELLRDNPIGRDLSSFRTTLESSSTYPTQLIEEYLNRRGLSMGDYTTEQYQERINFA